MLTRRELSTLTLMAVKEHPPPPTDPAHINAFANAFNAYTAALVRGELSLKLWKAAEAAWKDLS